MALPHRRLLRHLTGTLAWPEVALQNNQDDRMQGGVVGPAAILRSPNYDRKPQDMQYFLRTGLRQFRWTACVLLLAVCLACGSSPPRQRVLVLALDGLDPKIVDLLVAEGHLPHFQELAE